MWTVHFCVLLLTVTINKAHASRRRHRAPGYAAWGASESPCPCSNASLCDAITRTGPEKVFVFHGGYDGDKKEWQLYDWPQISTICIFGSLSPELYCHAHSHGVRVVFGTNFPPADQWSNATVTTAYIENHVANMRACRNATLHHDFGCCPDGWNLDIEVPDTPAQAKSMVKLTERFTTAMHAAVPGSQVTFDTRSLAAPCSGNPPNPKYTYDVAALAKARD